MCLLCMRMHVSYNDHCFILLCHMQYCICNERMTKIIQVSLYPFNFFASQVRFYIWSRGNLALGKRATALSLRLFEADGFWCFGRRGQDWPFERWSQLLTTSLAFWSSQMSTVRWCLLYNRWASLLWQVWLETEVWACMPSICFNCRTVLFLPVQTVKAVSPNQLRGGQLMSDGTWWNSFFLQHFWQITREWQWLTMYSSGTRLCKKGMIKVFLSQEAWGCRAMNFEACVDVTLKKWGAHADQPWSWKKRLYSCIEVCSIASGPQYW